LPQVFEHTLSALFRKHQVKDDRIVDTLFGEVRSGSSIGGMIDRQAGLTKSLGDVFS